MTTPPLLLAAALLLWGTTSDLLLAALAMALPLEASRYAPWRWRLSGSDFNRVADLCSIGFIGLVIYVLATPQPMHAIYVLLQWAPLTLYPLVAVQGYSTAGKVDLAAFFYSLRRISEHREEIGSIDLSYPYLALCILAASVAPGQPPWFYPAVCALVGWSLWGFRPRARRKTAWVLLVTLATGLGYAAQFGLHDTQLAMEDVIADWLFDIFRHRVNPYRNTTAIGSLGRLKLSDRIVLRVQVPDRQQPPPLLREASYNSFTTYTWPRSSDAVVVGTWFARARGFELLPSDGVGWDLGQTDLKGRTLKISQYLEDGDGILALPAGTYRIENLPVAVAERNLLNTVRVSEGPGLVTYTSRYAPGFSSDGAPSDHDLQVPRAYQGLMEHLASELGLRGLPAGRVVETVQAFFGRHFAYAIWPSGAQHARPDLEQFLYETRAGHCEYFATATVLLLRAAGVPARYAVGYSLQEYSALEKRYVVRDRHAHSWAIAYINDRWRDVDTTPTVWADVEQEHTSLLEPLRDWLSWIAYSFAAWRWGEQEWEARDYLGWALIPLTLLLGWRLLSRERVKARARSAQQLGKPLRTAGADSELYLVEGRLHTLGFSRGPGESLLHWLRRIEASTALPAQACIGLRRLLDLHYRYRFDPAGLDVADRDRLKAQAHAWLREYASLQALH